MTKVHGERAHSKFSASGAERYFECPGSVELSEGMPDKGSVWSIEGTQAHELLEEIMTVMIAAGSTRIYYPQVRRGIPKEMVFHGTNAANFIMGLHAKTPGSEVLVETRVYLKFIHPEMFGTFDGAVLDHFGTLHVFDYKYGAGHAVSPIKNLQMIFYGLGLAHLYDWNFKNVRLWIIQPRIKGYDGPIFWDLSIMELKSYVDVFRRAVERVLDNPTLYKEGPWCHWCKAKSKCPLKNEARAEKAVNIFKSVPLPGRELIFGKGENANGFQETSDQGEAEVLKSEADWRKEKARLKKAFKEGKAEIKEKGVKLVEQDFY